MTIWHGYDRAELDAQYGTREQIGDQYEAWSERWRRESEATRKALPTQLDLAYGPHARHRLDLFLPQSGAPSPALAVFFHGGFWRARDKTDYSYVAKGLSTLGGAVALVNYPLCPEISLGEIVRSARTAVRWLIGQADAFGYDARQIYLSGHSAGAHLAAMCCCGDGSDDAELPQGAIKGALLSSGLYELEPVRLCFANDDVRLDAAQVEILSPARLAPSALDGPMFVTYGTAETDEFAWQATHLVETMRGRGVTASLMPVPQANHYTIVPQLEGGESLLLQSFRSALAAKRAG